jgi:hypothetical protein
MRISVDKNDPGFDERRAMDATVYLDGVEIRNCVTADEELGECICFVLDRHGPLQDDGSYETLTEVKRGVVKIVFPS